MKDLKISKELLSEVLGYEVDAFLGISENEIDYTCCRDKNIGYEDININIYEFAFKCKEWAFKQGYELFSRILSNDHQHIGNCVVYRVEADPERSLTIMNEKTEQEAIFLACKWILEQRTNKCIK